jgi:hypothetical protein
VPKRSLPPGDLPEWIAEAITRCEELVAAEPTTPRRRASPKSDQVLLLEEQHPGWTRGELARAAGCSIQLVSRARRCR